MLTKRQEALQKKHGTPEEFGRAVTLAYGQLHCSFDEARAAIDKYEAEWDEAGKPVTATVLLMGKIKAERSKLATSAEYSLCHKHYCDVIKSICSVEPDIALKNKRVAVEGYVFELCDTDCCECDVCNFVEKQPAELPIVGNEAAAVKVLQQVKPSVGFILDRIVKLTKIEVKYKTPSQLMGQALCEMGELSEALNYETKVFGTLHRTPPKEAAAVEAVDVAISALAVAASLGHGVEDIIGTLHSKLDKWESKLELNLQIINQQMR